MAISDDWLHLNAKFNKSWPICSKFSPLSKMEDLPVSATAACDDSVKSGMRVIGTLKVFKFPRKFLSLVLGISNNILLCLW